MLQVCVAPRVGKNVYNPRLRREILVLPVLALPLLPSKRLSTKSRAPREVERSGGSVLADLLENANKSLIRNVS